MIPFAKSLKDWLFSDEPSILKPRLFLKGLCPAFFMLDDPKNLKKQLLQGKEDKN